ncbi:hemerythrin domain-containing protein [Streptomyces sp. NBC_00096]|uniref:hemerythrin domain-containing protein n=1 Tax=Streptomyces sp. NBC_00096 TaxID=2975650 RepID=UPI0032441072
MESRERPFTHDMVVVHRMFRREFHDAAGRVRAAPEGGRAQVDRVAGRLMLLLETLHHHHAGEDALLWPALTERLPESGELWRRMESQHEGLSEGLGRAAVLLERWAAAGGAGPDGGGPSGAGGEELAAVFEEVSRAVGAHLDEEEREVLPLVPGVVSREAWAMVGEAARSAIPKSGLFTVLGMILKDADPREREMILGEMPLPPRVMWRLVGERNFRRRELRLRPADGR